VTGATETTGATGTLKKITLVCEEAGERIDAWLAKRLDGYSRSSIQKHIVDGFVHVNAMPAVKNLILKAGDSILFEPPPLPPADVAGQEIPLDIVYEDEHIIAVNKPAGMVVHPGGGNRDGTLANALVFHCKGALSDVGGEVRPGVVHRLDKDTSGLIVAAKSNEAHRKLADAFKERRVRRIYNAIIIGHIGQDSGRIDMPIGRHKTDRKRMAALAEGGRPAVTIFNTVARLPCGLTWLELELVTGRTHQIRVHLAQIGYPVAGDAAYGRAGRKTGCPGRDLCDMAPGMNADGCPLDKKFGAQLLHSTVLEFDHPITGEKLILKCGLPAYFPVI
jgi:23S rRNA pseudouridine1911/1915/1917 synthase